ncbi:glyceraldehyde-3-phosphate dehydrogenase 1 [Orbilia oligospora]|uniref:Glyceraldehyde-3-phosphate dehydrogenase 1 n=1 Tax=Orbilia oligospora TaxID=2813651 RepID=A0A7C8JFL5_ORBOL|nr:glyceraldehyde-3-phosphate dehydrogenase 1 [Orbilia oligospora]KAF3098544.1 glyceraldehyde-3-phosphate dehydrogenase 1 [Orbilia oligospora]KAF3114887.1 glyceraldehyde-3-phosphate dehydrogenase 1 [Orbilia oligospora]KAF3150685.1 glyceraldehyde-3-phosphate dehydrogenase 1 [Orbilia oligospora]
MSIKKLSISTMAESVHSPTYDVESVSPTTACPPHKQALSPPRRNIFARMADSFLPHPSLYDRENSTIRKLGGGYDVEAANFNVAGSPLARKLKGRHLQMIAIGGSIGSGLFVGSGVALATGGPGALLLAYLLIGSMLYCTIHALGELSIVFPVAGSFAVYSSRFLDPAWGFAMGWNYAITWLVTIPLEVIAATLALDYWGTSIPIAVWVTLFFVIIIGLNLFGVKGYGEGEFVFSIVKVVAVISFIILGVILNIAGGPGGSYIGGSFWHVPGAFANGFKGLCSVFANAAFSFSGTELVGMAAAETANPRKSLPKAVKQVFWRITLFYLVSLTLVGVIVPYDDPRLLGTSNVDARASPFVIAILNAGITVLPDIMNVVIMVAVLSVGNSAVFGASRTLVSLAEQGQAPKVFAYIDRKGRPMAGIALAAVFGLLSYIGIASPKIQNYIFKWLLAVCGLSVIFTWTSICVCHIRFRKAWRLHGHSIKELAFTSQAGVFGSYCGVVLNVLVLCTQLWISISPLGKKASAESFFSTYLCVPVVLLCYASYKIWFRTKWVKLEEIDLVTGRRELDLAALLADEREERASWPTWKKIYKLFC